MKKYILKQNKKKPFFVIGILCVVGVLLLFSSSLEIPYGSVLQLLGVSFVVAALSPSSIPVICVNFNVKLLPVIL